VEQVLIAKGIYDPMGLIVPGYSSITPWDLYFMRLYGSALTFAITTNNAIMAGVPTHYVLGFQFNEDAVSLEVNKTRLANFVSLMSKDLAIPDLVLYLSRARVVATQNALGPLFTLANGTALGLPLSWMTPTDKINAKMAALLPHTTAAAIFDNAVPSMNQASRSQIANLAVTGQPANIKSWMLSTSSVTRNSVVSVLWGSNVLGGIPRLTCQWFNQGVDLFFSNALGIPPLDYSQCEEPVPYCLTPVMTNTSIIQCYTFREAKTPLLRRSISYQVDQASCAAMPGVVIPDLNGAMF
jgi:hypothetical protein